MKIRHRIPSTGMRSAELDPDYAAEVQAHTERMERAYARLQRAEERYAAARARKADKRELREAVVELECCRQAVQSAHPLLRRRRRRRR